MVRFQRDAPLDATPLPAPPAPPAPPRAAVDLSSMTFCADLPEAVAAALDLLGHRVAP